MLIAFIYAIYQDIKTNQIFNLTNETEKLLVEKKKLLMLTTLSNACEKRYYE
jgi:hypothetical protein